MARGDRREEIFRDDRDRGKFLGYLAEGVERYSVKVHCYVMMENHFHLKELGIRNNLGRRCAITLCWDHAGLSHDEIAALFRMPSSNSVAQTIRRTKAHDAQTLKVLKNQISHK